MYPYPTLCSDPSVRLEIAHGSRASCADADRAADEQIEALVARIAELETENALLRDRVFQVVTVSELKEWCPWLR